MDAHQTQVGPPLEFTLESPRPTIEQIKKEEEQVEIAEVQVPNIQNLRLPAVILQWNGKQWGGTVVEDAQNPLLPRQRRLLINAMRQTVGRHIRKLGREHHLAMREERERQAEEVKAALEQSAREGNLRL